MHTILLTGATGFLGSNLARTLRTHGYKVRALRRKTSDLSRLVSFETDIEWFDVDNENDTARSEFFSEVDAVIHTAATYARHDESLPSIAKTNIVFALGVLESSIRQNIDLFINIDSALPSQTNAYSLSKAQFANWGRFMAARSHTRFLNLRVEHIYGPGDDESKFVDRVINACLRNESSLALTTGMQQRDFIYVDDVISACLILLKQQPPMIDQQAEISLGSGKTIAIRTLVELIHTMTQSTTNLDFGAIKMRPGDVMYSCADISSLTKLGWQPKISIENGLRLTIESKYP